jgi:hypothetical protein
MLRTALTIVNGIPSSSTSVRRQKHPNVKFFPVQLQQEEQTPDLKFFFWWPTAWGGSVRAKGAPPAVEFARKADWDNSEDDC